LHQFTGPDHEDYELIGEAIKRVEAVAQENNKAHAANSNINKLLALQEMFNAQVTLLTISACAIVCGGVCGN
jgi:hypothetical protein